MSGELASAVPACADFARQVILEAYRRELLDVATDIANGRHSLPSGADMVSMTLAMETAMAGYSRPNAIAALKAAVARYPQRSLDLIIADAVALADWLERGRRSAPADAGQSVA